MTMASRKKQVIDAILAKLTETMAGVQMPEGWLCPPKVQLVTAAPVEAPTEGHVIIGKGRLSPTASEFGTGGPVYECVLTVPIEIHIGHHYDDVEDPAFDAVQAAIGAAITADPSLGGLVDDTELVSADDFAGGDDSALLEEDCQIALLCTWYATNPLG
jgi:hypothetical protein